MAASPAPSTPTTPAATSPSASSPASSVSSSPSPSSSPTSALLAGLDKSVLQVRSAFVVYACPSLPFPLLPFSRRAIQAASLDISFAFSPNRIVICILEETRDEANNTGWTVQTRSLISKATFVDKGSLSLENPILFRTGYKIKI